MMAGESTQRESLESLRRRARLWAGWEPLEIVQAEMDQSALDPESTEGQQVSKASGKHGSQ